MISTLIILRFGCCVWYNEKGFLGNLSCLLFDARRSTIVTIGDRAFPEYRRHCHVFCSRLKTEPLTLLLYCTDYCVTLLFILLRVVAVIGLHVTIKETRQSINQSKQIYIPFCLANQDKDTAHVSQTNQVIIIIIIIIITITSAH